MPPSTTAIECVARPGGHCLELPSRPLSWSMQPARLPISSPFSLDVDRSHGRSDEANSANLASTRFFLPESHHNAARRKATGPVETHRGTTLHGRRRLNMQKNRLRGSSSYIDLHAFISAAMAQVFRPEAMRQELFSDTYLHVTTRPRGSGDVILKRGRGRAQLLRTDPTR